MAAQMGSVKEREILNEIIDNAIGLPIESQDWLLMLAKSMRYTRDCVIKENKIDQSCK